MRIEAGQGFGGPHLAVCSEPCLHRLTAVIVERWERRESPLPTQEELLLHLTPNGGTLN